MCLLPVIAYNLQVIPLNTVSKSLLSAFEGNHIIVITNNHFHFGNPILICSLNHNSISSLTVAMSFLTNPNICLNLTKSPFTN